MMRSPTFTARAPARGIGAVALAALAALAACDANAPDDTIAAVHVVPGTRALTPGQSATLSANAVDAEGKTVPWFEIRWTSSNHEVATVSSFGTVTAKAVGEATITGTIAGKQGTARIQVFAQLAPVASVALDAGQVALAPGGTRQLVATPKDAEGRPLTGREVTWATTNAGVATVSATGLVTARAVGTATVTATSEGKSASATVTVTATAAPVASVELDAASAALDEGGTRRFVATPKDASGQPLTGRGIVWTSSDAEVAHVAPGGLVTAVRVGSATITATVEGKSATAAVTVSADYAYDLAFDGWNSWSPGGALTELFRLDIRQPSAAPERMRPTGLWGSDVAVSPDGTRIAYVSGGGIHVANVDGSGTTQLTAGGDDQPSWSPDGTRIAFRRSDRGAVADIWVVDAEDGGNAVNLTADLGATNQHWPTWSPASVGRIAFEHVDAGAHRIWSMRADGSDKRAVTTGTSDVQPAWSPDGQTIAFQRSGAAIFGELWLASATGDGERRLMPADLPGPQWAPAWSPDGRLIAFASRHETYGSGEETHQIYTVWADGSKIARRTSGDHDKQNPAWIRR